MSLIFRANPAFYYQMQTSTFKIVEFPTYLSWQLMKHANSLWKNETEIKDKFLQRSMAVIIGATGYLGGIAALPITLCATPLTILADSIVGSAECIFCGMKGASRQDLLTIAHRKFIVAPLQQLTFCIGVLAGYSLFIGFVFIKAPLLSLISLTFSSSNIIFGFWPGGYFLGQIAVGLLPKWADTTNSNIFCYGGCGDMSTDEKWTELKKSNTILSSIPLTEDDRQMSWDQFLKKEIPGLRRVDDADLVEEYIEFKRNVVSCSPPHDLLSLIHLDDEAIDLRFRSLAHVLHPQRNESRKGDAEILFKALQKAAITLGHSGNVSIF